MRGSASIVTTSCTIFCGSVKGIDLPASAVPSDLAIQEEGNGFMFSGRVTADPPVYGVVAYTDPDGGGDYDATTATAVLAFFQT